MQHNPLYDLQDIEHQPCWDKEPKPQESHTLKVVGYICGESQAKNEMLQN